MSTIKANSAPPSVHDLIRQMSLSENSASENTRNDWFAQDKSNNVFGDELANLILQNSEDTTDTETGEYGQEENNEIFTLSRQREFELARKHYQTQWDNYCEKENISPKERAEIESNESKEISSKHRLMWMLTLSSLKEIESNSDEGYEQAKAQGLASEAFRKMHEAEMLKMLTYAFVEKPSEGVFDSDECKSFDEMFLVGGKVMIMPLPLTLEGILSFAASDILYGREAHDAEGTVVPLHKLYQYPRNPGIYFWEEGELTKDEVIHILEHTIGASQLFITDVPATFESYVEHHLNKADEEQDEQQHEQQHDEQK